jgi:hypothetical protein
VDDDVWMMKIKAPWKSMATDWIVLERARNLKVKNLRLQIPRNKNKIP